jgi:hypothetical protein
MHEKHELFKCLVAEDIRHGGDGEDRRDCAVLSGPGRHVRRRTLGESGGETVDSRCGCATAVSSACSPRPTRRSGRSIGYEYRVHSCRWSTATVSCSSPTAPNTTAVDVGAIGRIGRAHASREAAQHLTQAIFDATGQLTMTRRRCVSTGTAVLTASARQLRRKSITAHVSDQRGFLAM